jgi:hypothetical protein
MFVRVCGAYPKPKHNFILSSLNEKHALQVLKKDF